MTTYLVVLAVPIALVVVIYIVGLMLPRDHQYSAERQLPAGPERVWELLLDAQKAPLWRSDIATVQTLSGSVVREIDKRGRSISYEIITSEPFRRLVRRIADQTLPFSGSWTFILDRTNKGCVLKIIEDGNVNNPVYRFASKFILGHSKTVNTYLDDLEKFIVVDGESRGQA